MAGTTRLGLDGYPVRPAGSFAGKPAAGRPVGLITRLSVDGYGARRAGAFDGRAAVEGIRNVIAIRIGVPMRIGI